MRQASPQASPVSRDGAGAAFAVSSSPASRWLNASSCQPPRPFRVYLIIRNMNLGLFLANNLSELANSIVLNKGNVRSRSFHIRQLPAV